MKAIITYKNGHKQTSDVVSVEYVNGGFVVEHETSFARYLPHEVIDIKIVEDKEQILQDYFELLKANKVIAKYVFDSIMK